MIVETARSAVAILAGCSTSDVVFTSGGTEANNLVMAQYDCVITSSIEHDSVRHAHQNCYQITVDKNGVVDLDMLALVIAGIDDAAKPRTLISIMAANNETGVIQPMEEIAVMAESANIALHSDMVQIFGKCHINFAESKTSYASLSAHKIGGPSGVGALLVRPGCRLSSLLRGGGQEQGRRAGTENLVGIAGFGGAAVDALGDIGHYQTMAKWRDDFESRMLDQRTGVAVFGRDAPRLGNTSCIAALGKAAETMVMAFDIAGVAISAGSACSSGKVKPSHVLESMGAELRASEAIRISGGWATTKSDFETLADIFLQLYKQRT
jgi:cysteine desulfurase